MKRLFIAIPLTDTLRNHIHKFSTALHKIDLDASFVATENLHLTLKFLGNVDEKNIPSICQTIEKTTTNLPPFSAAIKNVGVFPSLDKIQTIWIGVESKEMFSLTKTIQHTLNSIRPEEHPEAIPHLTVLRVKSNKNKILLHSLIKEWQHTTFGTLLVDKVVLYESILTPNGPKYIIITEFKLK